ncbi:uncharacterized protein LOC119326428 [Triticum dicoccoides]|nr:uncharacterized protein LOC119326428 [Triticum dicoccoides]
MPGPGSGSHGREGGMARRGKCGGVWDAAWAVGLLLPYSLAMLVLELLDAPTKYADPFQRPPLLRSRHPALSRSQRSTWMMSKRWMSLRILHEKKSTKQLKIAGLLVYVLW